MEGILHTYHPGRNLHLFEHTPNSHQSNPSQPPPPNTLLFIGGMYDNFLHPAYTTSLSTLFPRPSSEWSLMHVQLSSAGRSFGLSSLSKDISEIATAITYIRTHLRPTSPSSPNPSPIVLLGHSTGCQDIMAYLSTANPPAPNRPTRPAVQGAILQAPVSDRDQLLHSLTSDPHTQKAYDTALSIARSTPSASHHETLLPLSSTTPLFGPVPMTVSRFLSLASPDSPAAPGADDFFSQDATDAHLSNTFGQIPVVGLLQPHRSLQSPQSSPSIPKSKPTSKPASTSPNASPTLLVLMSGADEFVPEHINKPHLLQRWRDALAHSRTNTQSNTQSATPSQSKPKSKSNPELELESESEPEPESTRKPTLDPRSTIIPNARHGLDGDDEAAVIGREVVFRRVVLEYLDRVAGVGEEAWGVWRAEKERIGCGVIGEGDGGADGGTDVSDGIEGEEAAGVGRGLGRLKL